jgi:hypothetical protein
LADSTAWAAFRTRAPKTARRLVLLAAVCSTAIVVLTIPQAPLMWRIGSSPNDPAVLAELADRFVAWTVLRFVLADVSFWRSYPRFCSLPDPSGRAIRRRTWHRTA